MAGIDPTTISRARQPDLIPGYRLEALLGRGGMGEVHKATQLSLNRTVAVKVLASELAKDPSFVSRFEKEAAALATLSHPNIVDIVDKGRSGATWFLVMEYIDGLSLREVMRSPLLEPGNALRMVMEICRGVEYAHSRGVIHRDLKPENILFDEQAGGIAKVTDFGLASFREGTGAERFNMTETHVSMGTYSYMAPEQRLDARKADHRADIYSLGVILYELLVGEVPAGQFAPPSSLKPGVDPRVDAIVGRCLKPDPGERYARVSDLMADLEPLVPGSSLSSVRQVPAHRLREMLRRTVKVTGRVVGGALVLSALVVLGVSWARSRRAPEDPFAGAAVARDLPSRDVVNIKGRIEESGLDRRVHLGEGPDTLPLLAFGRAVSMEGSTLLSKADRMAPAGRYHPDVVDLLGPSVRWRAQVSASPEEPGFATVLHGLVFGEPPAARASLLLQGTMGRYAAVSLSRPGEPMMFEWALGERRGVMLGPVTPEDAETTLELAVDEEGLLRAFAGKGEDRRAIAEPVHLGTDWAKHFGGELHPGLGCLDGTCRFTRAEYQVTRSPPPTAPVVEAMTRVSPEPVAASKVAPAKQATTRAKKAPVKTPRKPSSTQQKKHTRKSW